jgi:lipoyl(octanoyl) transferase
MSWRLINFQRYSASENMAIDEAIFRETIKNNKPPTIRFYGWRPPAVSIGYFQDIEKEVNIEKCRSTGIDIVRRPSGGKAVFHRDEITYSVVACRKEKKFPSDILGTYKIISHCLVRGLSLLGINAQLAETGRPLHEDDLESFCFSVPSRNELLVSGRKICGSAQMRVSGGFLQHGSILINFNPVETASFLLPLRNGRELEKLRDSVTAINEEVPTPFDEEDICANLKNGFTDVLGIEMTEGKLTYPEEALKSALISKYSVEPGSLNGKKKNSNIHSKDTLPQFPDYLR